MKALLITLAGPMQAWGTRSRFSVRDTQLEPSKSGVIGLIAAALGRRRHEPLDDLTALRMGVRVDREGRRMRDYHTVGGGTIPRHLLAPYGVKTYGVSRANRSGTEPAVTERHYLADARFLVALAGEKALLLRLIRALREPVFPLFLGRKSFVPSEPVVPSSGEELAENDSLEGILAEAPWEPAPSDLKYNRATERHEPPPGHQLRLVLEVADRTTGDTGELIASRPDQPLSFLKHNRQFRERNVRTTFTARPVQNWLERQPPKEVKT